MKNILIFSIENDSTTHQVIDWIIYYNYNPIIIETSNLTEFLQEITISTNSNSFEFNYKDKLIHSDSIIAYWYRRSHPINPEKWSFVFKYNEIDEFTFNELKYLNYALFHVLKEKRGINNMLNVNVDKIQSLIIANECGLKIPPTKIILNGSKLNEVVKNSKKNYINKPIFNVNFIEFEGEKYLQYTSLINQKYTFDHRKKESIFPTLIQDEIKKMVELRIFFLDNKLWSMAIFSQNDVQTAEDFRRYNNKRPNRTVPFNLPKNISEKLILFMKRMDINCGSIDMILDFDENYYFLEVNPVGQFGMTSGPCNYYLEKELSEILMKDEKK